MTGSEYTHSLINCHAKETGVATAPQLKKKKTRAVAKAMWTMINAEIISCRPSWKRSR